MEESKEELKSLLMRVKEESEKAGLKLSIQKPKIMASSHITSWQIEGGIVIAVTDFTFLGSKTTADGDCSHEIKRCLFHGREAMTNLDSIFKSRDITLLTKVHIVKKLWFSSSHVRMWELNHKEDWAPKNWCFSTMVMEKTLESSLDSKEIKLFNPKGNQPWIFIGRTDAEAETPILWPHNEKNWLIGKDPDAGKDWRQEKKGMTEDKMVGWHHQLNGHGFGRTTGVGGGQRGLVYCGSWGHKESDTTEWQTELNPGPASCIFHILSSHGASSPWEWLQSDGCQIVGILLLPECP